MNIVQTYARQSSASINAKDVHFDIAQELSRENGVSIYAMVNHSLDYARIMLALQQVVVGDWRTPKRDVAAAQMGDAFPGFLIFLTPIDVQREVYV